MNQKRVRTSSRKTKTVHNSQMGEDLFSYLPSEIILNILLRLPDRTIMRCKCVSRAWLNLLVTPDFVDSHLSNSVPGLVALLEGRDSELLYHVYEFVDELNPEQCHLDRIFEFKLPFKELYSSVNGLIFLSTQSFVNHFVIPSDRDLFISNPITHEYIKLPRPESSSSFRPQVEFFGFGLSRITGQYKLVRIFRNRTVEETTVSVAPFKCQVYTVGTGSWRRISSAGLLKYKDNSKGIFFNGNLHWLLCDFKGSSVWISCFDLESELFSTFSPPPCHDDRGQHLTVSSLKDCLCFCDNSAHEETVIWLMKEYGDDKSWTKEFVIRKESAGSHFAPSRFCPVKVFKSGDDILMVAEMSSLFICFSKKTESFHTRDLGHYCTCAITYTPSFLRLKSFAMEKVTTFL